MTDSDVARPFAEASPVVEQPLRSEAGEPTPSVTQDGRSADPAAQSVDPVVASADPAAAEPTETTAEQLAGITEAVREVAAASERYHARAEQREAVIDQLLAEIDRLRRGERRGLLRPLLVQICRLRNDLLRQAEDLPGDFDAERASVLLRSYAESVELTLEDSGVVTFAPGEGDAFEPRMHRRVGSEPAADPAVAGRVARVRRHGYLDADANNVIAPAEVVLFGPPSP